MRKPVTDGKKARKIKIPESIEPCLWPLWYLWGEGKISRAEFDTWTIDDVFDALDTMGAFADAE